MLTLTFLLAAGGDGFFDGRAVDFWDPRPEPAAPPVDVWTDSKAPAPVRRLLEAPTREHAEAYLAWQHERMRRLQVAFEVVEEVQAETRPPGQVAASAGQVPLRRTARVAASAGQAPLLYFSRPGCRWCALQERELEGLPVVRVPENSPLWEEHTVRVTPTIVAGKRVFRGLTPRRELLEVLK